MKLAEVMARLQDLGSEQTRKTFRNHGCEAEQFGVKVGDMKVLLKSIRKNQPLALELFATQNADAQYLAGLAAVPDLFTKEELLEWVDTTSWHMVGEYAVAWNIAESPYCMEICRELLAKSDERYLQIAWASLGNYVLFEKRPDLDVDYFTRLIHEIEKTIHQSPNRVRYVMNGFLIALGASERDFLEKCKQVAKSIGEVKVFMGNTACKVPDAISYLEKIEKMGRIGKKKKTVKC